MSAIPERVRIVEVGPRDGLQNEATPIATAAKLAFIRGLIDAGLGEIEATSFVSPKSIPQLADAGELAAQLVPAPGVVYSALVPNAKGLERARAAGFRRVAVFTAASDEFTRRNINMGVDESLATFEPVVREALAGGMSVRGYVSTSFVCPYAGEVPPRRVREVSERLIAMGCDEVAISDTLGAAAPRDVERTLAEVLRRVPVTQVALHLHDTYGTALANVYSGLMLGVATFDASAGGLGGCPYAKGASGNLATEDLVYFLERMGIATGVDLAKLAAASSVIARALGRELPGRNWKRLQKGGEKD